MTTTKPSPLAAAPPLAARTVERLEYEFGIYKGEVIRTSTSVLRDGKGTCHYSNGNVYDGEWRMGAPHGDGQKRYANGDVYSGPWRYGKRDGPDGTYRFANGHEYAGSYLDDDCSGLGTFTTAQGDSYVGGWLLGKKHGTGTERLRDGQTFNGTWEHGKKQGLGVLRKVDGGTVEGIWEADKLQRSSAVEKSADGSLCAQVVSSAPRATVGGPLLDQGAIRELAAAGVDPSSLQALELFSDRVGSSFGKIADGVDAMTQQVDSLAGVLEELALVIDEGLSEAPGDFHEDDGHQPSN